MIEHRSCNREAAKNALLLPGSAAHFAARHKRTDNTRAQRSRAANIYSVSFDLLLTLRDAGVFDPDGHHRLLTLGRRAVDSVRNFQPGQHPAKGCELSVQMRP